MPDETPDIISAARRHRMFQPGDKVLVAVSGGPDSIAMLHALHSRSRELGIELMVGHLNHDLRKEESGLDQVFVAQFAKSLDLSVRIRKADVQGLMARLHIGMEEAARLERHQFLQETAEDYGTNKIAIGHTADDRAESVLLNMIRGCGIDGLCSIRPVSSNIVRPLIDTYRDQIEDYIAANGLSYRVDQTNADTAYTRNRVRHELLPTLAHDFNPQIKRSLVRLAEIATGQSELMESLSVSARVGVARAGTLDADLLASLSEALQYQVIRAEIARHKGDLMDVEYEQVLRVIEALRVGGNFSITLTSGTLDAVRRGQSFCVKPREWREEIQPFEIPLEMHGSTHIPALGITIDCEREGKPTPRSLPANEALIRTGNLRPRLYVRSIRPGDRIVPLGMSGSKKLQDIFVDKKIRRRERARAAVVCDDEKILWVVGVVSSELAKVLPTSRAALHLTAVPDQ